MVKELLNFHRPFTYVKILDFEILKKIGEWSVEKAARKSVLLVASWIVYEIKKMKKV